MGLKQLVLALLLSITAQSSLAQERPAYDPVGVQNDVPVSTVLEGGWRILFRGLYHEGAPSVPALFKGACGQIMLAGRQLGAEKFDVLATIDASLFIPLITERNVTVTFNGAQWYKNQQSLGFAGFGDTINQTSADTSNLHERDRLSWHTIRFTGEDITRLNPGWRSGNNFRLEDSSNWERYVLTRSNTSTSSENGTAEGCIPIG